MIFVLLSIVFAPIISVQQTGILLIGGVLLDVLVVRTLLMPALLTLGVHWQWWPRSFKESERDDQTAMEMHSLM